MGNRLTRTVSGSTTAALVNGQTVSTYDANDRITSQSGPAGSVTHSYDANGNETTVNGQAAAYDFENHVVGLSGGTSYTYDADGSRVGVTAGGVTTSYLVDTSLPYASVVEEYSGSTLSARYDYGDDLVRMDRGSGVYYYLYDGLGSTRQLVNTGGSVTDGYSYDAFGEGLSHSPSSGVVNPFLFNAQQFDTASGDYYLRARYYDQSNGRFLSQDPHSGSNDDPISLHRYLYASCDPVGRVDPSGQGDSDNLVGLSAGLAVAAPLISAELPAIEQAGNSAEELIPQIGQDAAAAEETIVQQLGSDGEGFTEFYHVTTKQAAEAIRNEGIDLAKSREDLDFGRGFYTSTDLKQVVDFAQRNLANRFKDGYEVLTFKVQTADLVGLSGRVFSGANQEWEQFVLSGRLGQVQNTFDYVVGPLLRNPGRFVNGAAASSSGVQISWNTDAAVRFLYDKLVR